MRLFVFFHQLYYLLISASPENVLEKSAPLPSPLGVFSFAATLTGCDVMIGPCECFLRPLVIFIRFYYGGFESSARSHRLYFPLEKQFEVAIYTKELLLPFHFHDSQVVNTIDMNGILAKSRVLLLKTTFLYSVEKNSTVM